MTDTTHTTTQSLYESLIEAGIETDHHEGDLYFADTAQARAMLAEYPTHNKNAQRFVEQITGETWVDIPFGYDPFYDD